MLDLTNVKNDGDLLPDGTYEAVCTKAEIKDTKDGSGQYINTTFKVVDFDRNVFNMFNIKNKNDTAVKIGLGQLKSFLIASGRENNLVINSVTELEGLRCMIKVGNKTDSFGEKNIIKKFEKIPEGTGSESEVPF